MKVGLHDATTAIIIVIIALQTGPPPPPLHRPSRAVDQNDGGDRPEKRSSARSRKPVALKRVSNALHNEHCAQDAHQGAVRWNGTEGGSELNCTTAI